MPKVADYERNALIALDLYLGKSLNDAMQVHDASTAHVSKIKKEYNGKREEILRTYFMAGAGEEGRKAVVEAYGQAPVVPPAAGAGVDWSAAISEAVDGVRDEINERISGHGKSIKDLDEWYDELVGRLDSIEKNLATLVQQTAPTAAADTPDEGARSEYPAGDLRRENYRVHVTHQASGQWIKHFGAGTINSSGSSEPAADNDIRRRIIGVYYAGSMTGSGQRWDVTGVNRYSMDGVRLKCVVERDVIYISQVEKIPLTEV